MTGIDRIGIMQGDITRLAVDAIVNAANSSLLGGGGVDGAIHRAAGPDLLEACRRIGGCPTGEARITEGFLLPARYVIHTVGPVYNPSNPDQSARILENCYKNCLLLAKSHGIQSIAFPAISCGVYGYPILDACEIAIDSTLYHLSENEAIESVTFVLYSEQDFDVYKQKIKRMKKSDRR